MKGVMGEKVKGVKGVILLGRGEAINYIVHVCGKANDWCIICVVLHKKCIRVWDFAQSLL